MCIFLHFGRSKSHTVNEVITASTICNIQLGHIHKEQFKRKNWTNRNHWTKKQVSPKTAMGQETGFAHKDEKRYGSCPICPISPRTYSLKTARVQKAAKNYYISNNIVQSFREAGGKDIFTTHPHSPVRRIHTCTHLYNVSTHVLTCTTYPDMYLKLRGCLCSSTTTSPVTRLLLFLPASISSNLARPHTHTSVSQSSKQPINQSINQSVN